MKGTHTFGRSEGDAHLTTKGTHTFEETEGDGHS